MWYYSLPEDRREIVDYDLHTCLENNPQSGFVVEDIADVLAVFEGENDGDNWRWVLRLADGRIIFLYGGCDYTGWDCQSYADHAVVQTADEALALETVAEVRAELARQLAAGKSETWRQRADKKFGL